MFELTVHFKHEMIRIWQSLGSNFEFCGTLKFFFNYCLLQINSPFRGESIFSIVLYLVQFPPNLPLFEQKFFRSFKSFSKSFIHVIFCPPLSFLTFLFTSSNAFFAGVSSDNLMRCPHQFNLLFFIVLPHFASSIEFFIWDNILPDDIKYSSYSK